MGIPAVAHAQMIISGRVVTTDGPVQGASVGIPSLRIETRTIADGSYNFLVPAAQVRGQRVTVEARHRQFGSNAAQIALAGGSHQQNFVLTRATTPTPRPDVKAPSAQERRAATPALARLDFATRISRRRAVDSLAFAEAAGPLDVASALAGRVPGLLVTTAAVPGGTSPMFIRGPRSISGSSQPLLVVDGVPIDNSGFTSALQLFGLGGFDYGSPLQDVALDDIAMVTLLDGAEASTLYGSRGANGVLAITTKQGGTTRGFSLSHRLLYSNERPIRLPSYQNQYGQGLGGQFEFFDGMGGGINDDVDQSWGPKFDGRPIAQASLTQPRRPDVRPWIPYPGNVREDYFGDGRTIDAHTALQDVRGPESVRLALNARTARGALPGGTSNRIGITLNGVSRRVDRLTVLANAQLIRTSASDRPASGFDEANSVAGFTRMGRQVDFGALRANIRDTAAQVNWIYTARNNPFFQSFRNSNDDHRGHIIGGGTLRYDVTDRLRANLRAGTDNYHERRNVQVARGWNGGYPTALGRANFSGGGSQRENLSAAERVFDLQLNADGLSKPRFNLRGTTGIELRHNEYQRTVAIDDSSTRARAGSRSLTDSLEKGGTSVASVYVTGSASQSNYLTVTGGARIERTPPLQAPNQSSVFPAFTVTYDAAQTVATLGNALSAALLRVSWWRVGSEITPRTLARTYAGAGTPLSPALGIAPGSRARPELTTALELGTELSAANRRVGFDFVFYQERSVDLLLASPSGSGANVAQTGEISNSGYEVELRATPLRDFWGVAWDLVASFARNTNTVEKLAPGQSEVALSPTLWGASLVAREGNPLGVIQGTRYLRDAATGALTLRNGLPVPDASGLAVLGTWQPDWTAAFRSSIRFHGAEMSFVIDTRMGGKIFSATNMWGSYAGTLSSTLAGREDGLVIAGIDSISRGVNTASVSPEDYFHSLAAIHEAWVYDASYAKLRTVRLTYTVPLLFVRGYREQALRVTILGRNLLSWAKAPNIDPETALGAGAFQGFEMGQLPTTRSLGIQFSVNP